MNVPRGDKYHCRFCSFIEVCSGTSLQTSLLPVLQSCSFQVPDHPATPLLTAHELVYNHIPGPFSSHTEWMARFTAPGSVHCGDFPWPPPLRDPVTPVSLRLPNLVAAAPTKISDLQKRVKSLGIVKGVSYPPRVSEQIFFFPLVFIYLAMLGLSCDAQTQYPCDMWDLSSPTRV